MTKTLVYKPDSRYIDIEMINVCTFRINLECGKNDGLFIKDSKNSTTMGKCSINLHLRTKNVCDEKVCRKLIVMPFF